MRKYADAALKAAVLIGAISAATYGMLAFGRQAPVSVGSDADARVARSDAGDALSLAQCADTRPADDVYFVSCGGFI